MDVTFFIQAGIAILLVLVLAFVVRQSGNAGEKTRTQRDEVAERLAKKRAALAKNVKTINWREEFAIDGGGFIDRDHQMLFRLINQFNANVPRFRKAREMAPYLEGLKKYTQAHFAREEKMQAATAFLSKDEHKQEHAAMVAKLDEVIKKASKATDDTVNDVAAEIGEFLIKDWLAQHVLESDLSMRAYVERIKKRA
jgi:hemerythrin